MVDFIFFAADKEEGGWATYKDPDAVTDDSAPHQAAEQAADQQQQPPEGPREEPCETPPPLTWAVAYQRLSAQALKLPGHMLQTKTEQLILQQCELAPEVCPELSRCDVTVTYS